MDGFGAMLEVRLIPEENWVSEHMFRIIGTLRLDRVLAG